MAWNSPIWKTPDLLSLTRTVDEFLCSRRGCQPRKYHNSPLQKMTYLPLSLQLYLHLLHLENSKSQKNSTEDWNNWGTVYKRGTEEKYLEGWGNTGETKKMEMFQADAMG